MKCTYIGEPRLGICNPEVFRDLDPDTFDVVIKIKYPVCSNTNGCGTSDTRVRQAYTAMVEYCFELSNKIHKLHDHKGTLTITLLTQATEYEYKIMCLGWESVGELYENVEFEMVKSK